MTVMIMMTRGRQEREKIKEEKLEEQEQKGSQKYRKAE